MSVTASRAVFLALILVVSPACEPQSTSGLPLRSVSSLRSIDLLRQRQATTNSIRDDSLHIARVRVGDEIKLAVDLVGGQPFRLGPVEAVVGSELRFEFALLGRSPSAARLRLIVRTASDTGEVREAVLFDRRIERPGSTNEARWLAASVVLPEGFAGPVIFEGVAQSLTPEGDGSIRTAWADLVLLPPRNAVPKEAMNVILVTLDTMRTDHMSVYGYERDTTPFLRELARDAQVYERAYTPSTWTLPAHASLFTGLYPSQHGAITIDERLGGAPLAADQITLAEVLDAHGYFSMGIVAGPMLERTFGLDQGFALYSDRWPGERRRAPKLNDLALRWIDRAEGRPFFLFLNYFDAHTPYDPEDYSKDDAALFARHGIDPATFHWRFVQGKGLPDEIVPAMIERYDAEIAVVDRALQEIFEGLEARGLLDRTLVCIVGDHGESFGEHGIWGHGGPFYEPQARVPLFYWNPGATGKDVETTRPLSIVSLPSRILGDLGLTGLSPPHESAEFGPFPLYGERFGKRNSMRMLLVGSSKYLVKLRPQPGKVLRTEQLFDLANDSVEAQNLVGEDLSRLGKLRELFQDLLRQRNFAPERRVAGRGEVPAPVLPPAPEQKILEQQLRALGYVE